MQITVTCKHLQQMKSSIEISTHNLLSDERAVGTSEKGRFIATLDCTGKAGDSFAKTTLGVGRLAKATRTLQTQINVVSSH